MTPDHYHLSCPVCGLTYRDTYQSGCPSGCTSLLRAEYTQKQITIRNLPGVFRFSDWLPVRGSLQTRAAPVSYQSSGLAKELGLSNLRISFSGYWPEKGAYVTSGSFKEFEALPTTVRLRERASGVILVASAGNTGRAFAEVSAETGQPVIVVVPKKAVSRIRTSRRADHLLLIAVDGDYTDAITLGNGLSSIPGVFPEGGAKNVARRDGMGTVMVESVLTSGRMPDWYVQAVGSGTGGISAWEAGLRLVNDGRFGSSLPHLLLIQNHPFTPMVNAWNAGRREIIGDLDMQNPVESIGKVFSDVLTNRAPPYGISGGVYDALSGTGGSMLTASTPDAQAAFDLFLDLEGIDPDPAAAVAVAGLIHAVESELIPVDDSILLAITGGGYERIARDISPVENKPLIMVQAGTDPADIADQVRAWVNRYV
ncbi:MAG TPA: cysteate synthase [Methanospirillum sp.]|nr:cysteate synthase [Methanospirillum sp.]